MEQSDQIWPFKDKSNSLNVAIYAQPDGGKTSLLLQLCRKLKSDYLQVYMFTLGKFLLDQFNEEFYYQQFDQQQMNKAGFMENFYNNLSNNALKNGKMNQQDIDALNKENEQYNKEAVKHNQSEQQKYEQSVKHNRVNNRMKIYQPDYMQIKEKLYIDKPSFIIIFDDIFFSNCSRDYVNMIMRLVSHLDAVTFWLSQDICLGGCQKNQRNIHQIIMIGYGISSQRLEDMYKMLPHKFQYDDFIQRYHCVVDDQPYQFLVTQKKGGKIIQYGLQTIMNKNKLKFKIQLFKD